MSAARLLFAITALVFLALSRQTCNAKGKGNRHHCSPSSCGSIHNISYPFRLNSDPNHCGVPGYNLSCQNNLTVLKSKTGGKYYVQAINYNNYTIRLVDAGVEKGNCSSLPRNSMSYYNFTAGDIAPYRLSSWTYDRSKNILFLNCPKPVKAPLYLNASPCLNGSYPCNSLFPESKTGYPYVKVGRTRASDVMNSCRIVLMVMTSLLGKDGNIFNSTTYLDIHQELAYGFELSWSHVYCGSCGWPFKYINDCIIGEENHVDCGVNSLIRGVVLAAGIVEFMGIIVGLHLVVCLCAIPCVIISLLHKCRKRHLSLYGTIEDFLQSHNNLMPVRYSYSDLKNMTNGFSHKLGEGGYGSVYKGKLRSGHNAAIKMLSKSQADGQDFINEVATIGMIHHVNVVRLIGFCVDGSKRALVYDFMPNGSLDRSIFSAEQCTALTWKNTYEIALGVARGIEYLHEGCNMQILHFDIKPHNILLDDNLVPKISDFGLAKLYALDKSIVPLTAARGTMGYMAPELFYKNIGGVSYKADVYSFGMLLLEMIGRRKNLNPLAEHSSQIYFPFYVHGQMVKGENVNEVGDATEEENTMIKKMTIVALWCIQLKPSDRPSMKKVLEMLQGSLESLQVPPKPLLYPEEELVPKIEDQANETESSSSTLS
ncbi:hypothetical protein CCACVL1_08404 [Corchorus capsularis]|uniref:Protein kinase domain-containing protein n=1 Tax=Corchorus capsularis TaxID=210143 RepID=A0A1R3J0Q5_COCAP|nr:hypothetical protein CCACVL1_08404 [Corchorus capsularis]